MSIPFMSSRLRLAIATLILLAPPALLRAQVSSTEEQRLQKLMADAAQTYVPKNHVTVGFHLLSSGGKVNYGNLGTVPNNLAAIAPLSAGAVTRIYNNGQVGADSLRPNETNPDGTPLSTPGGRYPLTSATDHTVIVGDLLGFTPGVTRNWSYSSDTQVTTDGHIGFSTYSATGQGGTAKKDTGPSAGVEFAFSRSMGSISKRVEWGFVAGVALNGINNKTSGTVTSTLHAVTDFYSLNGQPAPGAPYTASVFTDFIGSNGTVYPLARETTVPINSLPDRTITTDTPGGISVNGKWQVKGAYFLLRFGPNVRVQLTDRIGFTATAGVAGAYAGSTYSVVESFAVPNLTNVNITTPDPEQNTASKFLSGYYADMNLELVVNERTGLYGGISAQRLSSYEQAIGGRTAHIDIGSAVGVRGGISIKF